MRKRLRGYSLLEVAVALAIFGLLSSIVTIAVSRAAVAGADQKVQAAAQAALSSMVEQVGTIGFGDLAEGTFKRPDACPYDAQASCIQVLERDVEVTWSSELTLETQTSAVTAVTITATTTLPDGTVVTATRTFTAPGLAWSQDSGWAQVAVTGTAVQAPLYLLDADGDVVGTAPILAGEALIRASASSCPPDAPCRVALGPDGSLTSGNVSLTPATTLGPLGEITLSSGRITPSSVVAYQQAAVTARLLARNPDGWQAAATTAGSVCLWLTFDDGIATRHVPACNTLDPSQVTWTTYQAGSKGPTVGIPTAPASIAAQTPSGGCPRISGQQAYLSGSWQAQADCTSNTWGSPASQGIDGVEQPAGSTIAMTAGGHALVDLIWTSPAAAGYAGQPAWSWPMDSGTCATRARCQPAAPPPCAAGIHCNSSAEPAPWLASPAAGLWHVPVVTQPGGPGTTGSITLEVGSSSGPVTVTLAQAPVGTLRDADGNSLAVGASLGQHDSGGTILLTYQRGSQPDDQLTVTLTDGDGRTRNVNVDIVTTPGIWQVRAAGMAARQGQVTPLNAWTVGTDGNPIGGVQVSAGALPAGTSATDASSNGVGRAAIALDVQGTTAGTHTVTVSGQTGSEEDGNLRSGSGAATITVNAAPGAVVVSDATIGQGREGSVRITVQDEAGAPVKGALASAYALQGAASLRGVTATTGCYTKADGSCLVTVRIGDRVAAGPYTLVGISQGATGSGTLTVTASPGRVIAPGSIRVAQGASGSVTLTVLDGAGQAAAGTSIELEASEGLNATPGGPANAQGQVTATISVEEGTRSGVHQVTAVVAGVRSTFNVTVTGTPDSIEASDTLAQQGRRATVDVQVLDQAGDPAGIAVLSLPATAGISHPSLVRTSKDGIARIPVQVPPSTPTGDVDMEIRDGNGNLLGIATVMVSSGAMTASALDSAPAGAATSVRIRLDSPTGTPVKDAVVQPGRAPAGVSLAPGSVVSGTDGIATFTVTVRAGLAAGAQPVYLTVDGLTVVVILGTT